MKEILGKRMVKLKRKLSFDDFYRVLGASYKSLGIRALVVTMDNEWINSMTVLSLTARDEEEIRLDQRMDAEKLERLGMTKVKNLKFLQEVTKFDALPSIFDEMTKGNLTLGNYAIKLRSGYDKVGFEEYERYTIKLGEYSEYEILGYYLYSEKNAGYMFHKLNIEDETLSLGLSLGELGVGWLKVKGFDGLSINSIIALPVYAKLLELKYLGDGKVNLQLKAHKALVPNLKFVLNLTRYDRRFDTNVILDTLSGGLKLFPYEEQGDFAYINIDRKFKVKPYEGDRIHLRIVNEILGVLIEESPLIRDIFSYKSFEDTFLHVSNRFIGLEELEDYLVKTVSKVGSKKASCTFERGVAWLLSFLGFRAMQVGDLGLGVFRKNKYEVGETDVLTQDIDTKKIYFVSCSLKPPRPDEVDKIANLTGYFIEQGIMVEPLIFVSESASEVKRTTLKAKVIDRDDLIQVISLLRKERLEEAKRIIIEPTEIFVGEVTIE